MKEMNRDGTLYTTEFLNSRTPLGLLLHRHQLEFGCIVILLRNFSPAKGQCEGTWLKVLAFHDRTILCSPIHAPTRRGILPGIEHAPSDSTAPFTLRRWQFPVKLAYVMTIGKSLGQTFDRIGIQLPMPVFTHRQLYVTSSRVGSHLKIQLSPSHQQGRLWAHPMYFTKIIAYREVLN